MTIKRRIAFIVQRYGLEVNGGLEAYCRQVAERLASFYDVEVLTTCAVDYVTWNNEYPEGIETINGVTVRRFPVDRSRNIEEFNRLSEQVLPAKRFDYQKQIEWMYKQGPVCTGLLEYVRHNKDRYDTFIFMTYLYFTTFFGLQIVPEKSVLISTAHDEAPIYLDIFRPFFHLPRAFIYLTEEEKDFVQKVFHNKHITSAVAGIGIEVPENTAPEEFRQKHEINEDFIVYVGRIDESKGCAELFDYFIRYKKENRSDLKLVLMGKAVMEIPKHPDIISLGFVSEEDKYNGMAAARLLVLPSYYESLSMSVLESFGLGKPVLVNAKCEVLKGHCIRSNAGLYYENYNEFEMCLSLMLENDQMMKKMGERAKEYIGNNYEWTEIDTRMCSIIENHTID